uniref:Uncharacterized protein n=1 Tax=Romanomermis culicivorax TaxID=13658 RepID=A0A915J489_ROMCU
MDNLCPTSQEEDDQIKVIVENMQLLHIDASIKNKQLQRFFTHLENEFGPHKSKLYQNEYAPLPHMPKMCGFLLLLPAGSIASWMPSSIVSPLALLASGMTSILALVLALLASAASTKQLEIRIMKLNVQVLALLLP